MIVSGAALLLASAAFFFYDFVSFREEIRLNTSIQAQIVGLNAVSPLIFNDVPTAESTLGALHASPHILYAGIYNVNGKFFAGYWRESPRGDFPLPNFTVANNERSVFRSGDFELVKTIVFQGKPVGIVYIVSDLGALDDRLRSYGIILIAIVSASMIAALLLSRVTQRGVAQPILHLADTARQVTRDRDYSLRAETPGSHDEVALLVDSFNDMLHEIQARDSALQESERQFRTLADSIPQLAWMAAPNGNILWYNRRWYEYTGKTQEEMSGWGWQAVHDPEVLPRVLEKWRHSLATGEPFEMVFPLRDREGVFHPFLTLAMPVRDAQGSIVRWFGTNTDVTEQVRSAEALRQTEKLAATGRLAASIAHEINNPLEAVTNLVYLARRQPANVERYLALADEELDRIAQITKHTLGFYRDTASRVDVKVSEVLDDVLVLYSRKIQFKKIQLRREYAANDTVSAFPGELRQIFANLIANAIEALPAAGTLTLHTSVLHGLHDSSSEWVRATILDNGNGIAPVDRAKIFEPFYTTKKDVGTGLGLWLTLGLVQKHGGSLRVRSSIQPGKSWTAFALFLPRHPDSK